MGLYNMIFGANTAGPAILATLGFTSVWDVGRYRDCFVADGKIAVYTRNGGGNRGCTTADDTTEPAAVDCNNPECYGCNITHRLPKHSCYLSDVDDDYDNTYATIYFRFPEEYADDLRQLDSGEPFNPSAKWQAFITALQNSNPPTT